MARQIRRLRYEQHATLENIHARMRTIRATKEESFAGSCGSSGAAPTNVAKSSR
jgi:hypothetical protein